MPNVKHPKWLWTCPNPAHRAVAIRVYPPHCTCDLIMVKVADPTTEQRVALREANR